MLFNEPKKEKNQDFTKVLFISILASLLIGSLAGFGSGLVFWSNLDLFGYNLKADNGLSIEKVETEKITLVEEDSATIDVVKKSQESVVSIIISKTVKDIYNSTGPDVFNDFYGWPFDRFETIPVPEEGQEIKREIGGGTGFIVSADGLIITNKHVVSDDEAEYEVVTNDGQKYQATILAKDSINDLAFLKIEASDLKPLVLGDSDQIEIGMTVIAIGNTLSEFKNTVTKGVISGINRRVEAGGRGMSEVIEKAIQTDAAINPGNSGGPLLNLKGEVIGINTAISQQGQLVGFAIPSNEAQQVINSIEKYGKIVRPFLGVRYVMLNKQMAQANDLSVDYGALIIRGRTINDLAVIPGSPADQAGLEENDIILEVEGQQINLNNSLGRVLARFEPDQEVELKVLHDGQEKVYKATLIERE